MTFDGFTNFSARAFFAGACRFLLAAVVLAWAGGAGAVVAAEPLDTEIIETNGSFAKLNVNAESGLKVGELGSMLAVAGLGESTPAVVTAINREYVVVKLTSGEPLIGQVVRFERRAQDAAPVPGSPFWKPEEIASTAGATETDASADAAGMIQANGSPFWKPGESPEGTLQAPEATFEALRDKNLDFEYPNGQRLKDAMISGIEAENGQVVKLRVFDRKGDRYLNIDLIEVARIREGEYVIWENPSPAEAKSLAERRREINREQMEEKAARRTRAIASIVAETGQAYWPELTDEQRAEFIDEEKRFADEEVSKRFADLRLYETDHFLFYSTIPPKDVGRYILQLDRMYDLLVKIFQLSPSAEVFRGKGVVYCFQTQKEFLIFEGEFMGSPTELNVLGLCHCFKDGRTLLSCYMGDDPLRFEHVLVHEMSHGFIHRYKTPVDVPSWLNEGIAEYVGKTLVPKAKRVDEYIALALQLARATGRLGDDFFNEDQAIDAEEYGAGAALVLFLLKDSDRFVQLFEGIKGGLPTEEALARAYGCDFAGLTQAFGRSVGLPRLRP
jgi:hypothetical protein